MWYISNINLRTYLRFAEIVLKQTAKEWKGSDAFSIILWQVVPSDHQGKGSIPPVADLV